MLSKGKCNLWLQPSNIPKKETIYFLEDFSKHWGNRLPFKPQKNTVESTLEFRRSWIWPPHYQYVMPIPVSLRGVVY